MSGHDNIVIHGAMALYDEATRTVSDAMPPKWQPMPFQELEVRERTYWLRSSRCFLEAIREASDAMIWAGGTAMHDLQGNSEDVYHAYIDAALREAPSDAAPSPSSQEAGAPTNPPGEE